jgi:hypothetical protein
MAALALPVAAQEPAEQWQCGTEATVGERSLCAVLAPVVLVWPLAAVTMEAIGSAYTSACGEPLAPGWTVEETGTRPAYPEQWWYPCAVERPTPRS